MPLFPVSINVQPAEAGARKRSHEEFDCESKVEGSQGQQTLTAYVHPEKPSHLSPLAHVEGLSPLGSPAMTEAGSSTAARKSQSPETPTKINLTRPEQSTPSRPDAMASTSAPKRKKLTPAEKEAKEQELAEQKREKEREKEQKAAQKAVEKAQKAAEKAQQDEAKAREREDKRKRKEEEDHAKNLERDVKRRRKEEEQQRLQEEKDKKARAQPKLNNFFTKVAGSPKVSRGSSIKLESPGKSDSTASLDNKPLPYHVRFKSFYVKEDVRLASRDDQMDEEIRLAKSHILDEYLEGKRTFEASASFDPMEVFTFADTTRRGRLYHPVKHIMEQVYKESESDKGSEAMAKARKSLAGIPMKVIAFSQDVRPPYYGTMTFKPFVLGKAHIAKLARRPTSRAMPLDYDYDSEAEWQEEEGEDLDGDDDESDQDDEDDMDGFLDDAEDNGPARRVFGTTMEPDSTGVCFEDERRRCPNVAIRGFKMEFIHASVKNEDSVDPFSTTYWETESSKKPIKNMDMGEVSKMAPPPIPTDAFAALTPGTSSNEKPKQMIDDADLLKEIKEMIVAYRTLSKLGIVEIVYHETRGRATRAAVKNTINHIAEQTKAGKGRDKEWVFKPGHEISA